MEWSKIKNIIILMLVAVNFFLLILVVQRQRQSSLLNEQAIQNAMTVLEGNGIHASRSTIPSKAGFYTIQVSRDRELEEKIAASVLGNFSITELGGGVVSYTGISGKALFRSNGDFSISLSAGSCTAGKEGISSHAAKLLKTLQFCAGPNAVSMQKEGNTTTIKAKLEVRGAQVFNGSAVLTYEGSQLRSIAGKRFTGKPQVGAERKNSLSTLTVLFLLLRHVNQEGDICNKITQISTGYQIPSSLSDPVQLSPVWKISTDTGLYYINADTGSVERAN